MVLDSVKEALKKKALEKVRPKIPLDRLDVTGEEIFEMVRDVFPIHSELKLSIAVLKWRGERWLAIMMKPKGKILFEGLKEAGKKMQEEEKAKKK